MENNPKEQLNYNYNGDKLINLYIYLNEIYAFKIIQCKLKEKARYVIGKFKVKYSIEIKLNKDTLFISNGRQINLDSTIGENGLVNNGRSIIIISRGHFT